MELKYQYNKEIIRISEIPNDPDVEFDITIIAEKYWAGMKELQRKFEDNAVHTDVLFYPYENHHYKVIVRKDYYAEFIIELMKHQLLESVEWV